MKKLRLLFVLTFCAILSCSPDNETTTTEEEIEEELTPVIGDFSPKEVDLGDTISIRGKHFSRDINLKLDNIDLRVIFNNDSVIKFGVPYEGFNPQNFIVKLTDGINETEIFDTPFSLYEPVIDSVSSTVGFREYAVVYGKHLTNRPNKTRDIIYLNNENIEASFQSKDSIVFKLPYLNSHENDLLVKAQLAEITLNKGLVIPAPEITSLSKDRVKIGEIVTLYGNYFLPGDTRTNKVYIEGVSAEIEEAYSDSLKVKIPIGPYDKRELVDFKVEIFGKSTQVKDNVYLEDSWYVYDVFRTNEVSNGHYVGIVSQYSFVENGKLYLNTYNDEGSYNYPNSRISEYIPITKELTNFPKLWDDYNDYNGSIFQIYPVNDGEHIYMYAQFESQNFYKINYRTGERTPLENYPGAAIRESYGSVINNDLYMGLGIQESPYIPNHDFFKYQPDNNSWTKIDPLPTENDSFYTTGIAVFNWSNSLFVANGANSMHDFWKFTPNIGWQQMTNLVGGVSNEGYFQDGNRGYFISDQGKELWEYNYVENLWKDRSDIGLGDIRMKPEYAFVIGDYVYMIGYYLGDGQQEPLILRNDLLIVRTEKNNL